MPTKKTTTKPRLVLPNGDWLNPHEIERIHSVQQEKGHPARLVIIWQHCDKDGNHETTVYYGATALSIHKALAEWARKVG